jgi:hypothetical protein
MTAIFSLSILSLILLSITSLFSLSTGLMDFVQPQQQVSTGMSDVDAARSLGVSQALISLDVAYLRETAKNKIYEYKACALLIKDSNLICETGNNSRALRPEFIDLHVQGGQPTATEAAATAAQTPTSPDEDEEE